jgi:flagellar basal-body rod modification protein FlgD
LLEKKVSAYGKGKKVMSTLSITAQASDIQMDYMRLLVAELQNQNPLEPLDNKEMASQLAQLSQLEQLETMNSSFGRVLAAVERTYANSLIGKEISYMGVGQTGAAGIQNGRVEQVYNNFDGEIFLAVGDYAVSLADVISVKS